MGLNAIVIEMVLVLAKYEFLSCTRLDSTIIGEVAWFQFCSGVDWPKGLSCNLIGTRIWYTSSQKLRFESK